MPKPKKRFFRQPIRPRYQPPPITIWDWAIAGVIGIALLVLFVEARLWLITTYGNF